MAMKARKFSQSMLEYCKVILRKISFDRRLFRKEYRKACGYLAPEEQRELKKWIREQGDVSANAAGVNVR